MGALREPVADPPRGVDSARRVAPPALTARDTGARIRLRLLGIAPAEASFERRGFGPATAPARARLEEAGRTFISGYRSALVDYTEPGLVRALGTFDAELRGFAYEGAAMALALLDRVAPWRRDRLEWFIAGPARDHVYMAHVGAGWAWARLRLGPRPARSLDPLLRWLALDGYGFHQGYFDPRRHLRAARAPSRFRGYRLRAFDQGLGRSMWFAAGADPAAIAGMVDAFDPARRADIWSGVALAATYAGGAAPDALEELRRRGAAQAAHLAQGAAFAAAARERAGNPVAHSELCCRMLAGRSARESAAVVDAAAVDLPSDGAVPSYEVWRTRIRAALDGAG